MSKSASRTFLNDCTLSKKKSKTAETSSGQTPSTVNETASNVGNSKTKETIARTFATELQFPKENEA